MSSERAGSFARENIEAFAVAIAMALVIRHFCVEAFQIPSNSMRPSLCGRHIGPDDRPRQGDRILVDKFAYLHRDPRRGEVAVFLYPLNTNKNFIKRIAGLPGEWLRIANGDLWTSTDKGATWSVARKPAGLRDELLFPYYPHPQDRPDAFFQSGTSNWDAGGWDVDEKARRFRVDASGEQTLSFLPRVVPYDDVDTARTSSPPYVGDLRISFDLSVERAGELSILIEEHGEPRELLLSAEGSRAVAAGVTTPLDFRLRAGASHRVSFANVDDTLVISLDGNEREVPFASTDGAPPEIPAVRYSDAGTKWWQHSIAIRARGLKAQLTDLAIDRDIHYLSTEGEKTYEIPPDSYFMLGDNTQNSSDSRAWMVTEVKLKDGRVIRWKPGADEDVRNPYGPRPPENGDREVVVAADSQGLTRRFRASEIASWEDSVRLPFVPRENLVGRAYAVFWPLYVPLVYEGPTRVKLIR